METNNAIMNKKIIGTKFHVIILSLLFLMGCQAREKKIQADIEAANKAYCPMEFGNFGSLNSMEFDDGRLIYTFELKEPDLISLVEDDESNKKLFANYFMRIASSSLKNIFSQGYDCIIKFSSPSVSRSVMIELNSEEAKRILQEDYSKKEMAIEGARLSCIAWKCKVPMELDDGCVLINVSFSDNTIKYEYEIDDNKDSDLNVFFDMENSEKEELESIFQDTQDLLLKQYIAGGISLEYKYIGKNSKTSVSIVISPKEMEDFLYSRSSK